MRTALSIKSVLKWMFVLSLAVLLALGLWLAVAPPELIRVGANYSAKIVCSNVFMAGRDPENVLEVDVQAPGHPLLRLMRVHVDAEEGAVRAGLFGSLGRGLAVHHEGVGCAAVPGGAAVAARGAASGGSTGGNRHGHAEAVSNHPEIAAILEDPGMAGPGMRAILVLHDGEIVGERYGPDVADRNQPLLGWSMTKTVNAALVGAMVGAGRLAPDDAGLLPEWAGDDRARITVAHLLGMESGLAFNEFYGGVSDVTRMLYLEPDMAGFAASLPLLHPPGTQFSYSSGTSVILSRVWQNALEDEAAALEWPRRALFEPLGMETAVLETDAHGTFVGSSYIYASTRDWARFGQLLLQDGVWEGQRVLPQGWVDWMRTPTDASGRTYGRGVWMHGPRAPNSPGRHPDEGFDLPSDTYWLLGHDGQAIAIIPSRRLVVVRMGLTPTILAYRPQALVEALVRAVDE